MKKKNKIKAKHELAIHCTFIPAYYQLINKENCNTYIYIKPSGEGTCAANFVFVNF